MEQIESTPVKLVKALKAAAAKDCSRLLLHLSKNYKFQFSGQWPRTIRAQSGGNRHATGPTRFVTRQFNLQFIAQANASP